jgi:hypothetical protein
VSSAIQDHRHQLCMCLYTMSIHSVYLVSDLEVSDNGDSLNGMIYCSCWESRSRRSWRPLRLNVLRTMNEYEALLFSQTQCSFDRLRFVRPSTSHVPDRPRVRQSRGCQAISSDMVTAVSAGATDSTRQVRATCSWRRAERRSGRLGAGGQQHEGVCVVVRCVLGCRQITHMLPMFQNLFWYLDLYH